MTDEDITETVVEVMRLRLFGEESRAPEQVKEILLRVVRTTYTEAIEEAIKAACRGCEEGWSRVDNYHFNGTASRPCTAMAVRRLVSSSHGETEGEGT